MVDDERTDDARTDGRTLDHSHPISSPCEPNGSGVLKIGITLHTPVFLYKSGVYVLQEMGKWTEDL